jgi:flagellar basal body rod protein FlgG
MLNGLYSAAAGMIAQQTRMDALANDISRLYWLNGLGFSRDSTSSSSMLRRDLSLAVMRLRR